MLSLGVHLVHAVLAVAGMAALARWAASDRSDRLVWAVTIAVSAVVAALLFKASGPPNRFEDFTDAYLAAGRAVLDGPEALRPMLEEGVHGFVNLPIVAYLFAPFALLGDTLAGLAFFALGGVAVVAAWAIIARRYAFSRVESVVSLFALACFGPLLYSLKEGNTSHILLAGLAWGVVLVAARRDLLAGVVFAAAAIIKPPLLLIGVYYALRGRLRVALGGLALCVVSVLASLAVFGLDMHVLWLSEFRAYSGLPMPGFNVQSFAAAAARFELGPGSYRDWSPHDLALVGRVASWGLVLILAAAGVWASVRAPGRLPRGQTADELEFYALLAFICVASTVSWMHYYVWLLPGFAAALAATRAGTGLTSARRYLIAAFVLTAPLERLGPLSETGAFGPLTNIVVSHLLIGGVVTFGLLAWLRAGAPGSASGSVSGNVSGGALDPGLGR